MVEDVPAMYGFVSMLDEKHEQIEIPRDERQLVPVANEHPTARRENEIAKAIARQCHKAAQVLLLVTLHDSRGSDLGLLWILPELAQCATLPEEVPTLIKFHLQLLESSRGMLVEVLAAVESMFFVDQLLNLPQNPFIRLFC
jgi:hypothetical protein